MHLAITPQKLKGTVSVPPSKSMAHRAIICASLAKGVSKISHVAYSDDIIATINAMKALGANITRKDDTLLIDGANTFSNINIVMDCNESGSTTRFMIPISIVKENHVTVIGRGKLGERPLDVFYDIFDRQGIRYSRTGDLLHLTMQGVLKPDYFEVPGHVSSQFISGLLFALPLLDGDSTIHITTPLQSKSYIDLTLQMLESFGIEIINDHYKNFYIKGSQKYQPHDYYVESDFSQAAFFLVADVIGNDVALEGLNLETKQGDAVIIDLLERMGGKLIHTNTGYKMKADTLKGITVDAGDCPDLIPVLSVALALSEGESHVVNAARLRIKECDRLKAVSEMLEEAGVEVVEEADALHIKGIKSFKSAKLKTYDDHRMAMCEAILATRANGDIIIDNKECVKKSYPDFFEEYMRIGGICDECELGE